MTSFDNKCAKFGVANRSKLKNMVIFLKNARKWDGEKDGFLRRSKCISAHNFYMDRHLNFI